MALRDGHRVYPVDKFIFHHAVTPFWKNASDKFLIDWYSNNGYSRAYENGRINPMHNKPGSSELSYSNAHATLREYDLDGNKYGWRFTWLIDDPYNNVTWGAGNWAVNQTCINLEVCGNYLNELLPDKALMLVADIMRGHDRAIGGILKTFGHKEVSQAGTACPGRIVEQIDKFVDMLNNPGKWNNLLWPTPKPAPKPTPTPTPTPTPPAPVAPPAKSTYERYKSADGGQLVRKMRTKHRADLWNLNATTWGGFKSVKEFSAHQPFDVVGIAKHPLGAYYGMTAHSFGDADIDGTPNFNNGVNMTDLEDVPPPAPEKPKPGTVITPAPIEKPVDPITPPVVKPDPKQIDYEQPNENEGENMLKKIYEFLILGNQKAVVAFIVPTILGFIAFTGITGDMTVTEALTLLITGALTAAGVYLKANSPRPGTEEYEQIKK